MGSPVRGQLTESPAQPPPAATHTTLAASYATEVTRTSSQLAMITVVRMAGDSRAQLALDHVDLADPVELIAAEVEQHDHFRVHGVG